MENRIIEFVSGLRAAGVRVSVSESRDAFLASSNVAVPQRETFRVALRATLIKEQRDRETFDRLFPMYFGGDPPALQPVGQNLQPADSETLQQMLRELQAELSDLLRDLLQGKAPDTEQLREQLGRLPARVDPRMLPRVERELNKRLGVAQMLREIEALLAALEQAGMQAATLQALRAEIEQNLQALAEQVARFVGQQWRERAAQTPAEEASDAGLADRPFESLGDADYAQLQREVRRLAALVRTRAALRHKRGRGRLLDAKTTLRANVRHGGVPFALHFKRRHLKPKLTLICDVSTSMRQVVEFLLTFIYELQDQLSRTRSFAFIDQLLDISPELAAAPPATAVPRILRNLPAGHYNTDLGAALNQFVTHHLDAVDQRTTLIICGDGRNNYNDPRCELVELLRRRARRVLWLNPEPRYLWGSDDSDMGQYASAVTAVHHVGNLRELAAAVDSLLASN